MIFYEKGINIRHDIINNNIRVSTAKFPSLFGYCYESIIFNSNKNKKPKFRIINHNNEKSAIKIHNYIVNNLKIKE